MKRPRLVGFLGMGPRKDPPHYIPVAYEWEGVQSQPTALVQAAICEIFEPAGVVVLGTEDVEKRWVTSGEFTTHLHRPAWFRRIPMGVDERERWALFQVFVDSLRLEPLVEAGESEAPDGFLIDVTHGFRSQPIFVMSAVNFVMSEWVRRGLTPLPPIRLLYGSYDPARTEQGLPSPIWELTEFVTVGQWNSALDAFMRFGRADDLERLAGQEAGRSLKAALKEGVRGSDLQIERFLERLGTAARYFADDLAMVRTRNILDKSGPTLVGYLDSDDCQEWIRRFPLLEGPVHALRERLGFLRAGTPTMSLEGLEACAQLAHLYEHLQRFSEAAVTVREGLVTHFGMASPDAEPIDVEPGVPSFWPLRERLDKSWQKVGAEFRDSKAPGREPRELDLPAAVRSNIELASRFTRDRNDIEHGGFNDCPRKAKELREALKDVIQDFSHLVKVLRTVEASEDIAPALDAKVES